MNVSLSKLSSRLTGKATGRKHYAKICGMLAKARNGEVVFLDFEDVETVTGSWLNMAISPVFRWAAESQNDLFPVLTHFPSDALDELELDVDSPIRVECEAGMSVFCSFCPV